MKIDIDENTYLEVVRVKTEVVLSIKTKKDSKSSLVTVRLKKEDVQELASRLVVLQSEQTLHEKK